MAMLGGLGENIDFGLPELADPVTESLAQPQEESTTQNSNDTPDTTPRITRAKRKSPLSRLAEHKKRDHAANPKGSLTSLKEEDENKGQTVEEKTNKEEEETQEFTPRISPRILGESPRDSDSAMGSQTSVGRKKKSSLARLAAKKKREGSTGSLKEAANEGSTASLKEAAKDVEEKSQDVEMVIDDETWQAKHSKADLSDGINGRITDAPKILQSEVQAALRDEPDSETSKDNKQSFMGVDIPKPNFSSKLTDNVLGSISGNRTSSRAPSENTIAKFESLKMGNEETGEMDIDSPQHSKYLPRPPSTPKGEKRFREQNSSGDELAGESGRVRQRKYHQILNKETGSDYGSGGSMASINSTGVSNTDQKSVKKSEESGITEGNASEDEEDEEDDEVGDLNDTKKQVSEQMKRFLSSTPKKMVEDKFEMPPSPALSSGLPKGKKSVLQPVKSINPPPPFLKNFSSSSLRTSYKSDVSQTLQSTDSFDNKSMASTSVLPTLTTKKVRERNFLIGGMRGSGSLLGADELDRYFPNRQVRIFVGTWNMAEQKNYNLIKASLDDFLLPESIELVPDIYVIATQEMGIDKKEWEITLQETIGPHHVLFHSVVHGSLHMSVFLQRELVWYCSICEEDRVTTRAFAMIKTKGCVAVCFNFFGTSLLFIGAHFHSDDDKYMDRVADYNDICKQLALPKSTVVNQFVSTQENATTRFDNVFWCGDLNFRIERPRDNVIGIIEVQKGKNHPSFEDLLSKDQLKNLQNEGKIFDKFQEGRISFPPTYKFDIGTDIYDSSQKERVPSYTDRIMFRCKKKSSISCVHYDSVPTILASDHKPVYGLYEVQIRPGRDNVPLAAGQFNRDIYLAANQRRALHHDVLKKTNQKQSSVCSIQ